MRRKTIKKGMMIVLFFISVFVIWHEDESSEALYSEDSVSQERVDAFLSGYKDMNIDRALKDISYIGNNGENYQTIQDACDYLAASYEYAYNEEDKALKSEEERIAWKNERKEYLESKKNIAKTYVQPTVVYSSANTDGLTQSSGVNYYGDQKETYYNLNMSRVVSRAQDSGIQGDYWVRDDGVKMYGDYVIIAANQDVHPYGSTVDTSLGEGIVLDTGGFAAGNPTQVDIATDW